MNFPVFVTRTRLLVAWCVLSFPIGFRICADGHREFAAEDCEGLNNDRWTEACDEVVDDLLPELAVGVLAPAKEELHADLMPLREKSLCHLAADREIVLADLEAEAQPLDLDALLLRFEFPLRLLLPVLKGAVVEQFTDGGMGLWRDFDEIKTALGG